MRPSSWPLSCCVVICQFAGLWWVNIKLTNSLRKESISFSLDLKFSRNCTKGDQTYITNILASLEEMNAMCSLL